MHQHHSSARLSRRNSVTADAFGWSLRAKAAALDPPPNAANLRSSKAPPMSAHDELHLPPADDEKHAQPEPEPAQPQRDRRDSDAWADLKAAQIRSACRDADVDTLTRLATSKGGLLSDRLRRDACTPPLQPVDRVPMR